MTLWKALVEQSYFSSSLDFYQKKKINKILY